MIIDLHPLLTTSEFANLCHEHGKRPYFTQCPFEFFDCPFPDNSICQFITTEDWEHLFGNKEPKQEEL